MNRHNAKMNAFAVRLLDVGASDRVLEIGFGGGVNLLTFINRAAVVAGIDRSATAVRQALTRFLRSSGIGSGGLS